MKVIYINNYQHVISWTWRVAEKKKKKARHARTGGQFCRTKTQGILKMFSKKLPDVFKFLKRNNLSFHRK